MQPEQKSRKRIGPQASVADPAHRAGLWPSIGLARQLVVVFGLGFLVLLTFANTLRSTGFALDNKFIILEDPRLHEASRANVRLIFHEDYWWPKAVSGLYRPLTTLSYLFNYAILGNTNHAAGYHWLNFLVHWLTTALVFYLALVLMKKVRPALFIAALFATHPIVTESVTNIVGRSDLFATAAIVGGFLCYARSTIEEGKRKLPWLLALTVITTLGVFFKESAVMVLGVMGLYDFTWRLRRWHPNRLVNLLANFWQFFIRGYVAVLPPLVAVVWARAWVFGHSRPPEFPFVDNPMVSVAWGHNGNYYNNSLVCTLTAIKVVGEYFRLLLWPRTLSCDYSYNQVPLVDLHFRTFEDWKAILALAVVLGVIAVAVRQYRRNQAAFFFVMFFFLTLLPTSNLFIVTGSIMAERFLYLPSIGFAGCAVIAVHAISQRIARLPKMAALAAPNFLKVASVCALSLAVLACGVRAFYRNFDWDNDIALWTAAVKVCPNSFKTHKSLAYAFYERDSEKSPQSFPDIDNIIREGEQARAVIDEKPLPPFYRTGIVYLHLGVYYRIKGETLAQHDPHDFLVLTRDAEFWYRKSVETLSAGIPPDQAYNDYNRKTELARGRRLDQIPDVGNPEIYSNLGLSYVRLGQYPDAIRAYSYMRHLSPTDPNACLAIASVHVLDGKVEEAIIALLQTLMLDRNREEALRLVLSLYRRIDQQGCSARSVPGQIQPALNADCPLVHQHLCTAYREMIQVLVEGRLTSLAEQFKQTALKKYNCSSAQLEKPMPDATATGKKNE